MKVEDDGSLTFIENSSRPGNVVELRAEMNVLVVLANTPHVLDPRPTYTCTPVRVLGYRGRITPAGRSDPHRLAGGAAGVSERRGLLPCLTDDSLVVFEI